MFFLNNQLLIFLCNYTQNFLWFLTNLDQLSLASLKLCISYILLTVVLFTFLLKHHLKKNENFLVVLRACDMSDPAMKQPHFISHPTRKCVVLSELFIVEAQTCSGGLTLIRIILISGFVKIS